jgi:hypothetical protein
VSRSKEKETKHKKYKSKAIYVIQFFIIYVLSQQLQGQLQTQHSVDTGNYIMDKHTWSQSQITGKHWRKQHINTESKQTNKKMKMKSGNKNVMKLLLLLLLLLTQILSY